MSYHLWAARTVAVAAVAALSLTGCSGGLVASVNGQKITRAEFEAKLEASPQAKGVLNQLVQGALIDQYAQDNHLDVTAAEVDKKIDEYRTKYPAGQFDQLLKQQNLTLDAVKKIVREQLIVQKAIDVSIQVTPADVKAYLAQNHAQLDTPEQVRARHILVPDLPTAQKVEADLRGGADFASEAKKYSTDPMSKEKGGELGFFPKGQMVLPFQNAAFSQKVGAVGPPVKSPFGYHIIQVEAIKPMTVATLANSGDKIKALLVQQKEQQQIPQFLSSLRSKANIVIYDDKLKDALPPPMPPPPTANAAPPTASPAPPAASPAASPAAK